MHNKRSKDTHEHTKRNAVFVFTDVCGYLWCAKHIVEQHKYSPCEYLNHSFFFCSPTLTRCTHIISHTHTHTHQTLLRSDLPAALESALRGDERTALDVMRLVELLLVLIMEGRKALPKTSHLAAGIPCKLDSFGGDRNHRQVCYIAVNTCVCLSV